jgi:hypothetical protein
MYEGSVSLAEVMEGHDEKAEIGTTNSKFQAMEIKIVNQSTAFKSGEIYLEMEYLNETQLATED